VRGEPPARVRPEEVAALYPRCPKCIGIWGTTDDDGDLICMLCGHVLYIDWQGHRNPGWRAWLRERGRG
jgi:hypothetical protein